jgi:hypothetical protein
MSWVRVSVKILGLDILVFFYNIQGYVTLGMTVGVTTPTRDVICCSDEPRNATTHDAENLLRAWRRYCRDADKIFHICTLDEPRDALRHDIIEPTLSVATPTVATPTSTPNQAKRSIETPYDKILTNRHQASRRRQKIPYMACAFTKQDKTLENRRRAPQRLSS